MSRIKQKKIWFMFGPKPEKPSCPNLNGVHFGSNLRSVHFNLNLKAFQEPKPEECSLLQELALDSGIPL